MAKVRDPSLDIVVDDEQAGCGRNAGREGEVRWCLDQCMIKVPMEGKRKQKGAKPKAYEGCSAVECSAV